MSKGHFEAIKYALRQSKDGYVLSLVLHPHDLPKELIEAPIGTNWMIGFQSMGEASTREDEGTTSPAPVRPLVRDSSPAKTKWQKLRPSAQAALRCDDPHFRLWLDTEHSVLFHHWKGDVASIVRAMCGVHSRAELDSNDSAALEWAKVDADYLEWSGTQRAQQQHAAYARD